MYQPRCVITRQFRRAIWDFRGRLAVGTKIKTFIQLLLVGLGMTYVLYEFRPATWKFLNIVGLVLLVPGLPLWVTARLQLGDSFSVSAQAKQLVTYGLYSRIRNHVYVFGAIFLAGVALAIGKPFFLLALLLIVPTQIKRAGAESKVLEEKFGERYREYRRKTWI